MYSNQEYTFMANNVKASALRTKKFWSVKVFLLVVVSAVVFIVQLRTDLQLQPNIRHSEVLASITAQPRSLLSSFPLSDAQVTTLSAQWDPFAPWFRPNQLSSIRLAIAALTRAFDAGNVTYWVDGGTLIGAYRHHDIVPWDVDADILVSADDMSTALAILESLQPDFTYCVAYHGQNTIWRFSAVKGSYLLLNEQDACRGWRYPYVDIYSYSQNSTHLWISLYGDKSKYVWPKEIVFPLRLSPFGQTQLVPVPSNSGSYLGQEYGSGLNDVWNVVETCKGSLIRSRMPPVSVPCSRLQDRYPFVVRTARKFHDDWFVVERLVFKNQTIHQFVWPRTDPDRCEPVDVAL